MAVTKDQLASMDQTQALVQLLAHHLLDEKTKDKRFDNVEAQIEWSGHKMILPAEPGKMTPAEAKQWLDRYIKDAAEMIAIQEVVDCQPFDGAVAFMKALKAIYGWATPEPPGSFFEQPPTMISVDVSPTEKTTVIWGKFAVPGLSGFLQTGVAYNGKRPVFCIQGQTAKMNLPAVHEVAELTRKIVREHSIYRGQAIELALRDDGEIDWRQPPRYFDAGSVLREELIFPAELMAQVETNLFAPIEFTAECRKQRIPLRRGVLLEGPFGTGKTLCAHIVAQICVANHWTFVTVQHLAGLKNALAMATLYQPAVVFVEDIDRNMSGERDEHMDQILNVIDGVVGKTKEIMTVLTSNAAERINPALMRPGRLDAVLRIDPPDEEAAEKLMRMYGRGLIAADRPLPQAKAILAGAIPAVIREAVERAKLYAIAKGARGKFALGDEDIARAARGMGRHLELMKNQTAEPSPYERIGKALAEIIKGDEGWREFFTDETPIFETAEAADKTLELVKSIAAHVGANGSA